VAAIVLSRAINFGRQCHFKIWLDCHKFKTFPCLIMLMSTKCQKNEKKITLMSYNMMIGYDIYDRFTMEHLRLCQRMTLTTKIYCSRQSNLHRLHETVTMTMRKSNQTVSVITQLSFRSSFKMLTLSLSSIATWHVETLHNLNFQKFRYLTTIFHCTY
jgi:hypothetical protein